MASSGEEGLARLQEGNYPPALILLDVKMPGVSGIEVLRKIRGDKRLNYVHVAIVTNSIVQDDSWHPINPGQTAFFQSLETQMNSGNVS